MTKDEALRLALEWLEAHKPKISEGSLPVLTHAQVRAAVKAALERKTEDAEELGLNYYVPCCTDKTCPKCKAALEAKDEPVAFASHGVVNWIADKQFQHEAHLYSAPQRTWVGLTKDEVETLSYQAEGNTWKAVELAEAALKAKNA